MCALIFGQGSTLPATFLLSSRVRTRSISSRTVKIIWWFEFRLKNTVLNGTVLEVVATVFTTLEIHLGTVRSQKQLQTRPREVGENSMNVREKVKFGLSQHVSN